MSRNKLINSISLGLYELNVPYWSPYPSEYSQAHLSICEFCLKYFTDKPTLTQHKLS